MVNSVKGFNLYDSSARGLILRTRWFNPIVLKRMSQIKQIEQIYTEIRI